MEGMAQTAGDLENGKKQRHKLSKFESLVSFWYQNQIKIVVKSAKSS